jgi:hypothetical protein
MIKRAPLKKDPKGSCSRWDIVIYNQETKKYDWHTAAHAMMRRPFQRTIEGTKASGGHNRPQERKSFEQVANLCLDDRRANNRRFSTLEEYETRPAEYPQHQERRILGPQPPHWIPRARASGEGRLDFPR